MTLAELMKQVECQFEIPVRFQKWILDKTLANSDESSLSSFGIGSNNQNIYLYLVTPGKHALDPSARPCKTVPVPPLGWVTDWQIRGMATILS